MGLDGTAGRALGRRLSVTRERKRAADNDNSCRDRLPEVPSREGARVEGSGAGGFAAPQASHQRRNLARDTGHPDGQG